jgi:hypothetical protein
VPRNSDYTQKTGDLICERLAEGESLRAICRSKNMPSMRAVLRWLAKFPEFRIQYTEACEAREAHLFEEMREIADDGSNDWVNRQNGDGTTTRIVDHEHINRSKLRVETIRWQLSRMNPRRYGDRITTELTGDGGGPVAIEVAQRKDPMWWQNALQAVLAENGLKLVPLDARIVTGPTNRDFDLSPVQLARLGLPAPGNGVSRA